MTNAAVLSEVVEAWALAELRGDADGAARAAAIVEAAYRHGESVPKACRHAHGFVASWSAHPSHRPRRRTDSLVAC